MSHLRPVGSGLSTQAVHAGDAHNRVDGAAVFPVFQSATFAFQAQANGETASYSSSRYTRCNNNPSQLAVAAKLAALEGAADAVVTASGMAAITTVLTTFLSAGDHLIVQPCLYGGTYTFVHEMLPRMGVAVSELDMGDPASWQSLLRPNTKVVYVESISNPTCEVPELVDVVRLARAADALAIIDNTFASPANFRPLGHCFDLVVESCTKYLNGHSDVIAGVVAGSELLVGKVREQLNHLGAALDPHTCFLLHRGIKTLALRVARQNSNALALASALHQHEDVLRVCYPGLPTHPQHALAARLFTAGKQPGFGGVLSFELQGGLPAALRFLQALKVATVAPSLGGVETLVVLPAQTSHAGLSPPQRAALGITDGLVRVACGIEDEADLLEDFLTAVAQAAHVAGAAEEPEGSQASKKARTG